MKQKICQHKIDRIQQEKKEKKSRRKRKKRKDTQQKGLMYVYLVSRKRRKCKWENKDSKSQIQKA